MRAEGTFICTYEHAFCPIGQGEGGESGAFGCRRLVLLSGTCLISLYGHVQETLVLFVASTKSGTYNYIQLSLLYRRVGWHKRIITVIIFIIIAIPHDIDPRHPAQV